MKIINWIKSLRRWKIVDTHKYQLIPFSDGRYYFRLSKNEYDKAKEISKQFGHITYEFCPDGICYGLKIHTSNKVFDITDYDKY